MIVYVARALTATGRCARCEPCGEEGCGTEDSDDTPHSFSLGGDRLSRGSPATGAGCHFFFFRVKAPPIIRLTRLMLQVIRRGCATSHASGIHPAPIETILGTLSKVDSPMGSPGTAGAAAGRLANDCGRGRCCVVDSAFSAFGVPVLESSADCPHCLGDTGRALRVALLAFCRALLTRVSQPAVCSAGFVAGWSLS